MGQSDRSRTNRPKEAAVSDETQSLDRVKRDALVKFWTARWKKGREIAVFSHTDEASSAGLPTLATMSELDRRVSGVNVVHYGFGCFGAKTYKGEEIFGFCGGGAMQQDPAIDCSYTMMSIRKESRRMVIKILREIAPGGFAAAVVAKAKKISDTCWGDLAKSEIFAAAEAVLADMGTIGAGDEESVVRLQKAVDQIKALRS